MSATCRCVQLTAAEVQLLADCALGGAQPSSLMISAVEHILAGRIAVAQAERKECGKP